MSGETVFVGLGSNLGDSLHTLLRAWKLLGEPSGMRTIETSPPFKSAPVDMESHHWFVNAVGRLSCRLPPARLLEHLLAVEQTLGRRRNQGRRGYQDRAIDLDLLYFGSLITDEPHLTIPHPRRAERLFVLAPLAEIAPDFVDPQSGKTVLEMYRELEQKMASGTLAHQEITRIAWPGQCG